MLAPKGQAEMSNTGYEEPFAIMMTVHVWDILTTFLQRRYILIILALI